MFKIQEAKASQTVTKLLGDVQVVVVQLKFAVFLNAADFEFVIQRAVQPHFTMGFGDVIVNICIEIFDIFGSPAADQFALVVFAPANADTGRNCLMVVAAGAVAGHNDFQNRTMFELVDDFVDRYDVTEQFLRQNRGVGDDVEVFDLACNRAES